MGTTVRVDWDPDEVDWQPIPGFAVVLPDRFTAAIDDPALPYLVDLELVYAGERVECERLCAERRPTVRRSPVAG